MELNTLKPAAGATKGEKRVGRGQGSGHGKTACRGMNGAKSRSGYSRKLGFEGGQMPIQRRCLSMDSTILIELSIKLSIYQTCKL